MNLGYLVIVREEHSDDLLTDSLRLGEKVELGSDGELANEPTSEGAEEDRALRWHLRLVPETK